MQFSKRQMDSKSRIFIGVGSLCLAIGLSVHLFIHPAGQAGKDWLDGMSGMMIGISIVTNVFGFRLARRCRAAAADSL
jgi:hypothetical protein